MSKPRFSRADALLVARELNALFEGQCERKIFAGSLRRRKPDVGDIEIVYIPAHFLEVDPTDMFGRSITANRTDVMLQKAIEAGVLERRKTRAGFTTWGEEIKLASHVASGIPIDFFAANGGNWFNYLVCRTGGALSNVKIAQAAKEKGWKWNPFGEGFSRKTACRPGYSDIARMNSERAVFEFVNLPFREPWERE